jgi:hypothetical protein
LNSRKRRTVYGSGETTNEKVKEVLRLHHEGIGYRAISRSTNIGLGSVSHYIQRAKSADLTWPLPEDLTDAGLRSLLFPKDKGGFESKVKGSLDFKKIHEELKYANFPQSILSALFLSSINNQIAVIREE